MIAIVGIAAGVLGDLGGTYLGWKLSKSLALEITESEREYQEMQTVRLREEDAAEALHAAVIEIQREMPDGLMKARDAIEPLRTASETYGWHGLVPVSYATRQSKTSSAPRIWRSSSPPGTPVKLPTTKA